jgi:nucleotide-binding universal stress UspA family protein
MGATLIVSYDGTPNDDDALALGKLLGPTGATLALAYVRHTREFDPSREELAQHDAERRLEQGAAWLGEPGIERHVAFSASTGAGLESLARSLDASMLVFGSDYRTPPGHAEPGNTAQYLLEGGPVAVAVAAAGLRTRAEAPIESIGVLGAGADEAAQRTADALSEKLGARLVPPDGASFDLLVVGSRPDAAPGRIALSGAARSRLNGARTSVLVVPVGSPIGF